MINSQSSNSLEHSSSNSNNIRPPTKKPLIEEIPKRQSYQSYREHNQNSHGSNSSRDHGQNHNHNLSKSYHSGMRDHNRGSYSRSASQYHHHDRDRQGPDLLPKGSTLGSNNAPKHNNFNTQNRSFSQPINKQNHHQHRNYHHNNNFPLNTPEIEIISSSPSQGNLSQTSINTGQNSITEQHSRDKSNERESNNNNQDNNNENNVQKIPRRQSWAAKVRTDLLKTKEKARTPKLEEKRLRTTLHNYRYKYGDRYTSVDNIDFYPSKNMQQIKNEFYLNERNSYRMGTLFNSNIIPSLIKSQSTTRMLEIKSFRQSLRLGAIGEQIDLLNNLIQIQEEQEDNVRILP